LFASLGFIGMQIRFLNFDFQPSRDESESAGDADAEAEIPRFWGSRSE